MRPYEVSQIDLEIENTALNRDKYDKKNVTEKKLNTETKFNQSF